jgi:hypothetical protein
VSAYSSKLKHALPESAIAPAAHLQAAGWLPCITNPQADEWPNFRWADLSPLLASDYQGWGFFMPQNIKEPNNLMPPELCAGANYTEYLNSTWGWADTDCQAAHPYMCKVTRV